MGNVLYMPIQDARKIARAIAEDLNDRSGLGIDSVDESTQNEIIEAWAKIIKEKAEHYAGVMGSMDW